MKKFAINLLAMCVAAIIYLVAKYIISDSFFCGWIAALVAFVIVYILRYED